MYRISISIFSLFYFFLFSTSIKEGISYEISTNVTTIVEKRYPDKMLHPTSDAFYRIQFLKQNLNKMMMNCAINGDKSESKLCRIINQLYKLKAMSKMKNAVQDRVSSNFLVLKPKVQAARMHGMMDKFWSKYCRKDGFAVRSVFQDCVIVTKIHKMEDQTDFSKFYTKNQPAIVSNLHGDNLHLRDMLKRIYSIMKKVIKNEKPDEISNQESEHFENASNQQLEQSEEEQLEKKPFEFIKKDDVEVSADVLPDTDEDEDYT
ncbi:uncharacterized protein LOC130669858 [Microplitis mediator]|uniref:uncharacterized protein LOC130669858 n=1 Tax=Microplitis mediator TaxID=375433 RepID=UPI0025554A5C|nr:uncharacterized protein LOC130669858 [Microplitis mediator]